MEFTITLKYQSDCFISLPKFLMENCKMLKELASKSKKGTKKTIHLQCSCVDAKVCNTHQKVMEQKYFKIPTKEGEVYQELAEIIYLKAAGHYTHIYLNDGSKIVSCKNIGYFGINIPQTDFRRCHYSYIINIMHIKEHHNGRSGYFTMNNNQNIPFASRRKDEFADIIGS